MTLTAIRDVFPGSVIFPVLGNTDYWPINYTPFNWTEPQISWDKANLKHDTNVFRKFYQKLWNQDILSVGDNDEEMSEGGYYIFEEMPFEYLYEETFDALGDVYGVVKTPNYLPRTRFMAINT